MLLLLFLCFRALLELPCLEGGPCFGFPSFAIHNAAKSFVIIMIITMIIDIAIATSAVG
jgi:hypothetical protein